MDTLTTSSHSTRHCTPCSCLVAGTARDACCLATHDIETVYRLVIDNGASQYEIARRTGQSQSEVHDILHNGRQVTWYKLLKRIADGLGIPRGMMGLANDQSNPASETADRPVGEVDETVKRRNLVTLAAFFAREVAATAGGDAVMDVEGLAGHRLFLLGDFGGAVVALESSLRDRQGDPRHTRTRCVGTATLAAAHLSAGNLRDGITAAQQCLEIAHVLRSAISLTALTPLRQAAARRQDSTCQDIALTVRRLQAP